jgi:Cu/Ag efflux protein CusF
MSKVLIVSSAVFLMILCVGRIGWSQQTAKKPEVKPPTAPAAPAAPQGKQILGDVVKIDQKTKIAVVKTPDGEKKFDFTAAALAGYGALSDVKAGDKIAVLYEEKNGKLIAKAVANHAAMMKMRSPAK